MTNGIIHSIETFGTLDGPGTRYVLFLKGCPLRCLYCHNPDTWEMTGGSAKTPSEVLEDVLRYRNFYKNGGVTLSGGEPMLQHDFVLELLDLFHKNGIHTALDTAGSLPISKTSDLIDAADMLLLDIKSPRADVFEKITGQKIDNTLDTLEYCEKTNKRVWIRHVVIPGLTDDDEEELAQLLKDHSCVEYVDLLPFHKLGEYKWKESGLPYTLYDTPEGSEESLKRFVAKLSEYGITGRYNH